MLAALARREEELIEEVTHLYHGGVYDIYFTEFVMQ